MHRVTRVRKNKGQLVPDQYWQKMLPEHKSAVSYSVVDGGVVNVSIEEGQATLDAIQKVQEAFKDYAVLFTFTHSDTALHDDDKQPFALLYGENDKVNPILVAAITGDVPAFDKPEYAASKYYNLANDFLVPEFAKLLRRAGGDFGKFMDYLRNPELKADIEACFGERGSVVLLSGTGEFLSFTKNGKTEDGYTLDAETSFEWGVVSDTFGYGEGEFPEKKEAPTSGGGFKMPRLTASVPPTPASPSPEPKKEGKGPITSPQPAAPGPFQPPKTSTAIPPTDQALPTELWIGVPDDFQTWSKNQQKNFFNSIAGYTPDNFRSGPNVRLHGDKVGKFLEKRNNPSKKANARSFAEMARILQGEGATTVVTKPERDTPDRPIPVNVPPPTPPQKDTEPHQVGKDVPLVPVKERNAAEAFFKDASTVKAVDRHANAIKGDPQYLNAQEEKYSPVWDQMGWKPTYLINWPREVILDMVKSKDLHEFNATLILNLINAAAGKLHALEEKLPPAQQTPVKQEAELPKKGLFSMPSLKKTG